MKLTLYRIEEEYKGMHMNMHPRVPSTTANGCEDEVTDRICACTSVYGCILSKEVYVELAEDLPLYVYEVCIDTEEYDVYQPSYEDVFDAFITGEYWIKKPVTFRFKGEYVLSPYLDIGSDDYIRFKFTSPGETDVLKDCDTAVYGSPFCFSFIATKPALLKLLKKEDGDDET